MYEATVAKHKAHEISKVKQQNGEVSVFADDTVNLRVELDGGVFFSESTANDCTEVWKKFKGAF